MPITDSASEDAPRIGRRGVLGGLLTLPVFPSGALASAPARRPGPFMLGADVTWIAEDEAAGATYAIGDKIMAPLEILRGAGFNYVRLRMFVDPARGYSASAPDRRWGGLERTVALGPRVREAVFDLNGRNAGGGPKPPLLAQGLNGAEAPGAAAPGAPPSASPAPAPRSMGVGGRYQANGQMDVYRGMAKDYGLT